MANEEEWMDEKKTVEIITSRLTKPHIWEPTKYVVCGKNVLERFLTTGFIFIYYI